MGGRLGPTALAYVLLGLAAIWLLAFQLPGWEHQHDTPLLNYIGFLISEQGRMPYRDIFETSMPLVMLAHFWIYSAGLAKDPAFFLLSIPILAAIAAAGGFALRSSLGKHGLLFGLAYVAFTLVLGALILMQRDWLALTLIAPAFLLCRPTVCNRLTTRAFLTGVLFGLVVLIKPQLALPAPLFILAPYWPNILTRPALSAVSISLVGFAVPFGLTWWSLVQLGVWDDFWFIVSQYIPLYVGQTGEHSYVATAQKLLTFVRPPIAGGFWPLARGVLVFVVFQIRHRRRATFQLPAYVGVVALGYLAVPYLSGQMWDYHFLPFAFFGTMALVLMWFADQTLGATKPAASRLKALVILFVALQIWVIDPSYRMSTAQHAKNGNVEKFEQAIAKWNITGQPVQPIDWTAGIVHAMLRQGVPIATPFLYDFHFYHGISTPVNAALRQRFISELERTAPALILVANTRPKVSGLDTTNQFAAFNALLEQDYAIVEQTDLYTAYRSHASLESR
jgi:hypothetical protein